MEKPTNIAGVSASKTPIRDPGDHSRKDNLGKVPTKIEDLFKE